MSDLKYDVILFFLWVFFLSRSGFRSVGFFFSCCPYSFFSCFYIPVIGSLCVCRTLACPTKVRHSPCVEMILK